MRRVYAGSSRSLIFRVREVDPSNATNTRTRVLLVLHAFARIICARIIFAASEHNPFEESTGRGASISRHRSIDSLPRVRCDQPCDRKIESAAAATGSSKRLVYHFSTKYSCRSLVVVIYIYIFFFFLFRFFSNYHAIYLFHRPVVAKPISATRSNGRASAQRATC